ncbi:hypothetical protein SDC9_80308 [bioreactor metagenome]|uniref:Uncharacterized protein n=1 Tax=bioreactor metagenome TaxID=1076179 RepID=A0A644YYQ4_9ZZZZ
MGIDSNRLISFENDAQIKCDKRIGYLPRLATELQLFLNDQFRNDRIQEKDLFNDDEMSQYRKHIDAVKILASSEFFNLTLKDDATLKEELSYFKKLADIIPCVITTNYDTFLEEHVLEGKFNVYSRVSDYYLSNSQGIGEVYKIHGTCKDPSTIIINEDDYLNFNDNSKIVSAKLLSTLCDYPMIILGYSLDDPDVKNILDDLVSSLENDKLREIEKNIIYVSYDPRMTGFVRETINFDNRGKRLSISSIRTNNFGAIFKELSCMEASISPSTVRKIRQVVKKIIISGKSTGERYKTIGIDDITNEDADKLVVVITDKNNARVLDEIPIYSTETMVSSILDGNSKFDPNAVVDYFLRSKRFKKTEYVPIFHFIISAEYDIDNPTEYLKQFIDKKREQFSEKLKNFKMPTSLSNTTLSSYDDMANHLNDFSEEQKPIAIMYHFDSGVLSEEEAMALLKVLRSQWNKGEFIKNDMCNSYFNCALTFISFKKLGMMKR